MKLFTKFTRGEKGATFAEYGLIAALIAVVGISAMQLVGSAASRSLSNISARLGVSGASNTPAAPAVAVAPNAPAVSGISAGTKAPAISSGSVLPSVPAISVVPGIAVPTKTKATVLKVK